MPSGEQSEFWIGAYVFNLVLGEVVAWRTIVWMIASAPINPGRIELTALVLAISLPFVFFPFENAVARVGSELSAVRAR